MAQRGSKIRHFRAPDELWDAARGIAERRGEDLSTVLRDALALYIQYAGPPKAPPDE